MTDRATWFGSVGVCHALLLLVAVAMTGAAWAGDRETAQTAVPREAGGAPLASASAEQKVKGEAQEAEQEDPRWVVFVGGTAERSLQDGVNKYGPSLAVEAGLLDDELKLEWGVTRFPGGGFPEWKTNLTIKMPFDIAPHQELAIGIGPTWTHSSDPASRAASYGAEAVIDYLFWPTKHIGVFVAPSYGYSFDATHSRSVGITAGIALAIF